MSIIKLFFLVLLVGLSFSFTQAQDFGKGTALQELDAQIERQKENLENAKKELEKLQNQRGGNSQAALLAEEGVAISEEVLAKSIAQRDGALEELYFIHVLTHQSPVQLDNFEFGDFYPPYLQGIKVVGQDGDVIYHAYIDNPRRLQNDSLARAAHELLGLQKLHRHLLEESKAAEDYYVQVTKKYTALLDKYKKAVTEHHVIVEPVIKLVAAIIASKGNAIELTVDALDKNVSAYKHLAKIDGLDNDFKITPPNYPKQLLEYRQTLKGDPVKWAEEIVKQSGLQTEALQVDTLTTDEQSILPSIVAKDVAFYMGKRAYKAALEEPSKALYKDLYALEIAHKLMPEMKKATMGSIAKGQALGIATDIGAEVALEALDGSKPIYLDAAWTEIEWFVARKRYHLAYAKLNALYQMFNESMKKYQVLYGASTKEAENRMRTIVTDKILKDGRYKMHLKFNKEVQITGFDIGDVNQQNIHGLPEEGSKAQFSPKFEPDNYYTDYVVEFPYAKKVKKVLGDSWPDENKDLVIEISALDAQGQTLDPTPLTIPLYQPILKLNPNYHPVRNPRLLEDIEDRWMFYKSQVYRHDTTHKLRQKKTSPISVKATLDGAEPKSFDVR